MQKGWEKKVLQFWFEELSLKQWFHRSDDVDRQIQENFGTLLDELNAEADTFTGESPEEILAAIIVLDQFPRNIFRGTAQAFAYGEKALAMTRSMLDSNDKSAIQQLSPMQRLFAFMPLEHSEKMEDQMEAVLYMAELAVEQQDSTALDSAVEHYQIIKQFGRFPHRNRIVGRESTTEELAYLKEANTFGQ
ncbi:DUF924 domain-containing protein [Candidatus Haliotispira prima]|uniref:DUF924 domain-containing protein n=1 Tax=Candidatus Haliotispira prima TaxID=3034016 RepID=A0ABY8MGF9_9SPIO|nr:DUF924 domain-containing protein [Candidatus Haliotispira prima]